MKALRRLAGAALLALSASAATHAALVERGGGLVYDTEQDITWLTDPALLPGPSTWEDAAEYASNLVHAGGSHWLMPLTPFFDATCPGGSEGYGCTSSEMGHLFHLGLGGVAGESVFDPTGDTADEIAAVALFPTLAEDWFWSWQIADDGANTAFAFHFGAGAQAIRDSSLTGHVLLRHAGDLGADLQRVDVPPTLPLVLAAGGLGWVLQRRRRALP